MSAGSHGELGGHLRETRWRGIVADPNGNREQRRAARKLGVVATPPVAAEPTVCVRCCEPIDGPVADDGDGPRHTDCTT